MSHYYQFDPKLNSQPIEIHYTVNDVHFTFQSDKGVFSKSKVDFGTDLMIKHIEVKNPHHILDMGCGYGVVGIVLKHVHSNAIISLFDINPRAVELTNKNIATHKIKDAFVYVSDGVPKEVSGVDLALLNPPIRAGKEVVFSLYAQAHDVLVSKGTLYVVIQKKQGAESSLKYLKTLFHEVTCVVKDKGYVVYQASKN